MTNVFWQQNETIWLLNHRYQLIHIRVLVMVRRLIMARFAPSQWETALLCNDVSHWLGANLAKSSNAAPVNLLCNLIWDTAAMLQTHLQHLKANPCLIRVPDYVVMTRPIYMYTSSYIHVYLVMYSRKVTMYTCIFDYIYIYTYKMIVCTSDDYAYMYTWLCIQVQIIISTCKIIVYKYKLEYVNMIAQYLFHSRQNMFMRLKRYI